MPGSAALITLVANAAGERVVVGADVVLTKTLAVLGLDVVGDAVLRVHPSNSPRYRMVTMPLTFCQVHATVLVAWPMYPAAHVAKHELPSHVAMYPDCSKDP